MARPIFIALLAAWLWRLILLFVLLKRIAALDLAVVPTHPDHCGGLGFVEKLPAVFSLFAFLRVRRAGVAFGARRGLSRGPCPILEAVGRVFVIVVVILCAPLTVFIPKLAAAQRRALLEYGALVGHYGRLVRRRWILREPIDEQPLLQTPEILPVADTLSLYESVAKMRPVPIGKAALLTVALPVGLPMLALFAIEVPIKDLLLKIVGILV